MDSCQGFFLCASRDFAVGTHGLKSYGSKFAQLVDLFQRKSELPFLIQAKRRAGHPTRLAKFSNFVTVALVSK